MACISARARGCVSANYAARNTKTFAPNGAFAARQQRVNHCEHCGTQMEEEELHGDPGSPFSPVSDEDMEAIRLHEVCDPFEASAGGECHNLRHLDS